jgi:hypothetical protein
MKVAIQDKYVEALTAFGDLNKAVDIALQRFTVEQITEKIAEFRDKDADYQAKYGIDFLTFAEKTTRDEAFVQKIEKNINKSWEIDFADWEFCYKGISDWTQKLKDILKI